MLFLSPTIEVLGLIGFLIAVVYFSMGSSVGTFTAFVVSLFLIYKPIKGLINAYLSLQPCITAAKRIYKIWDDSKGEDCFETESKLKVIEPIEEIQINNLFFEYEKGNPILEDISLNVKKGEVVAIIGESGIGKTTLIDLLVKFYPYQKGHILINGKELLQLDTKSYRGRVSLVTQETLLFNDTIRNNIANGKLECSEEEIMNAGIHSDAWEFIQRMGEKDKTLIGNNGNLLSGGERQRLALARSLVRKADVLILDEALSSVDIETEQKILGNLKSLFSNKIIILITHRQSTLSIANRFYKLDKRKLVRIDKPGVN